ncbi:MAG: hypothetical protein VB023_11055 [Oscillibacter sp.]|nr:hypothetical protein [Oscillibacter sp.]
MPNLDGTGPRFACGRNGRGFGRRFGNTERAIGHSFGRGLGLCRFADVNSKESLSAVKAALQRRMDYVETLLKKN